MLFRSFPALLAASLVVSLSACNDSRPVFFVDPITQIDGGESTDPDAQGATDTTTPDSSGPDVAVPDAVEPDVVEPDVVQPDVAEDVAVDATPDVVEPDVVEPDVVEPDVTEDVRPDVTPDVPDDVTPDVPDDVTPDVPDDVTPDVPEDVTPDVPEDVTPDVPEDVTPDVPADVTPDVPADVTPDVAPDVAPDVPVSSLVDGEACDADEQCRGGFCIPSPDWPGGYCTTVLCETFEDCASDGEDNRCLSSAGNDNFCVRICTSNADCRIGYGCSPVGGGLGYCAPDGSEPLEIDPDDYPYDLVCGLTPDGSGEVEFDFNIAPGTTAYMVTPFSLDGAAVRPLRIERPGATNITFGNSDFRLTPLFLFGFINPIVVPAVPQFAGEVVSGNHTLVVETDTREMCAYVLQESSPSTTIDLNVFLVGVPGVTASNAARDRDFQDVFETFDDIYGGAGVSIGTIRYYDVPTAVEEAYSIIRSQDDLEELVATSSLPGPSLQETVSMNVFFTQSFVFEDGSGVLGISAGLPGAAGLHGTRSSGVAFTSEFIGARFADGTDGSQYTGVVLAHEVGHFLGLFHTTEQSITTTDPLADTPECSAAQFPNACPDLLNLMFPLAGDDHTELSAGQVWQIQVSPLTR